MPSTSKTTHRVPCRSHNPATCSSLFSGRASRSESKSVRRASTAAWSSEARKRLRVERAGKRSRPKSARNASAKVAGGVHKRLPASVRRLRQSRRAPRPNRLLRTARPRRRAKRTCSSMAASTRLPLEVVSHQRDFAHPARGGGHRLGRGLDRDRARSDTDHGASLSRNFHLFPFLRRLISSLRRYPLTTSLHNSWAERVFQVEANDRDLSPAHAWSARGRESRRRATSSGSSI